MDAVDAMEGLKAHRINFASALDILEAITDDGGEARPNPVAMYFYRLIKQEEKGAASWRVWGAFSGERAANAQEKEEGEKLVRAFAAGDSGAIHAYRVRNQIIDAPSGKEALDRFGVDGVEETRHGFCASLIIHALRNEGIENDRLNALDPCFKPAPPAAESSDHAAPTAFDVGLKMLFSSAALATAKIPAHTESLTAQLDAAHARIAELERQIDTGTPPYLDPNHPRHAYKLAAAIRAWEAISRVPNLKKSPKAAIADWLTSNEKSSRLSKQAIEECSAVANWNQKGGVPKSTSQ